MAAVWEALRKAFGLPTEPEKAARKLFRQRHPERIVWSAIAANEAGRFVISVLYNWGGVPPACRCYSVDKASGQVEELADDAAYCPQLRR